MDDQKHGSVALSALEREQTTTTQFFFMHIPKTAGTTLIQIIEQHFDEAEIARWLYPFLLLDKPPAFFREHRYFHGHVEHAVMSSFLPRPPVVMTMLRDPVERYLSQFGNHQRVSLSEIPDTTSEVLNEFKNTSLRRMVYDPPEILIPLSLNYQNMQAKMFAFELSAEANKPLQELGMFRQSRTDVIPTPTLRQTQQRLHEFAFVGLSERFQESLFLLAYTFGWPPTVEYQSYGIANQGQRPHQDELEIGLLGEIYNQNSLDRQLYDYAQRVFESRFEQMGHELLERYGRGDHSRLKLPLPVEVMVELLTAHYQRRFVERNPAVPALRLEFDRKISGLNWRAVEQHPVHGAFRWSGPGRCSTLDLPLASSSDVCLRFAVALAITEEVLASLVVSVNDQPVDVSRCQLENSATICEAYVPKGVLALRPGCAEVRFEVSNTVMPREVIPGSEDSRPLGIALNWLEITPADASAGGHNRLKELAGAT